MLKRLRDAYRFSFCKNNQKNSKCYSLLCMVRRTSELSVRPASSAYHPAALASGDLVSSCTSFSTEDPLQPLIPATYASGEQSTRILLTALFDFATQAFDEFAALDNNSKVKQRISIVRSVLSFSVVAHPLLPPALQLFRCDFSREQTLSGYSVEVNRCHGFQTIRKSQMFSRLHNVLLDGRNESVLR